MKQRLRLHPGQQALTRAQEAAARRFAEERITAQLSTAPVDEAEAEQLLRQVYAVAKLPPPQHIHWLNGPTQLMDAVYAPNLYDQDYTGASIIDDVINRVKASIIDSLQGSAWDRAWGTPEGSWIYANPVGVSVRNNIMIPVAHSVWDNIGLFVGISMWDRAQGDVWDYIEREGPWDEFFSLNELFGEVGGSLEVDCAQSSVFAYACAAEFAQYRFFDEWLFPNELHALAHLNERVSGYWLGQDQAFLVRRPRVIARDEAGRLHSATGKCLEYHDGWGLYAWHGVRVPEQIILAPDSLTPEDVLNAPNMEVRRVIQERVGDRFEPELGEHAD